MLTPVWFILVAIAIPCQAYLDDRVLLDQHWTGFSPTCGGVRREDSKASTQDRRHTSARQRDNEPDKRSAGRNLGRAETGPLMVRDMRSITVLNGETSLHFRSDSARKPEITERSVRRVLSNLERVSKRERIGEASVRTSRTERDGLRKLASQKQERETGDRRLHCSDCEGSYRTDGERRKRTTADAPTWVKEDSRRRVRSTDHDLNSSANRMTSSRSSRSSGYGASVTRQNAESVERVESQTRTDRQASSLERVSRLTENRAQGRELDTRFGLSRRQDENNRVSRVAAGRQGSRRRANDRVNRNRSFRDDVSYQTRLIVERRNDLRGITKQISFRSKSLSSRSIFTERHEMTERRRSTILPVQPSTERGGVGSPLRNERVASGLPEVHETMMPPRTMWDVRAQNHGENEDMIRRVHGIKRTERRTCEPLSSLHNEVRRTGADKRSVDSASEERRPDRFSTERTPPNMSDKRQRIHDGCFGSRDSRIDVRSMDDGERGNSYTMDQKFARSERRTTARSVSAVRRQLGVANGRFANTRETSIQVYRDKCQARNGDVDARQVDFPARIAQRSARAIVLEQRIAAEGRELASSTRFQSVERVEKRSEYRHDISDEQVRSVSSVRSRERIALDTRRTTDERRLAFARTQNARRVREFRDNFSYGESRRFENVYSRLKVNKNEMSDTTRSTRNSREAGDSYRQSPEDVRSSRTRVERYILERRHNDKMDIERAAPNDRRDVTIVQERHKTEHSSRRMFPSVHQADYGVQKELDYHEKHQKSPMFWDELASSYYRTNGSLLKTVLTVGVVAWMTMSPKKKLVD